MSKYKHIHIALLCGLVIAICASAAGFQADCAAIRENTFRLHIIANSDEQADQNVKLKVRDAVLALTEEVYAGCENQEQAKAATVQNLQKFEAAANTVLQKEGFPYTAKARIGMVDFDTREYEEFTLPAGEYEALEILLGSGEGKNWWCVMFPKICFSTCGEQDFDTVLDEKQQEIVTEKDRYRVAFRIVEIFDEIKQFFKKYI